MDTHDGQICSSCSLLTGETVRRVVAEHRETLLRFEGEYHQRQEREKQLQDECRRQAKELRKARKATKQRSAHYLQEHTRKETERNEEIWREYERKQRERNEERQQDEERG